MRSARTRPTPAGGLVRTFAGVRTFTGRARILTATLSVVLTFALAACGGTDADRAVTERDSVGVRVVTNHTDPVALPVWTLAAEPLLDIGVVEGDEAYQLFRVMDAARLPDGGLVVLNAGTQELRFFDEEGRFETAIGRSGEGPGEYRFPFRVYQLPGDSLLVYDLGLARFTVLDPERSVARTFRPERGLLNEPELAGMIGDSIIVTHETIYAIPGSGFDTMYARVAFIDLEGGGRDSLMLADRRMGPLGGGTGGGMVGSPHFEPSAVFAASDAGLWTGSGRTAELHLRGPDRSLRRVVRWPWTPRAVTETDVAAHVDGRVSRSRPESQPRIRRMLEDTPAAESFPAYIELQVDSQGRLWTRQFAGPGDEGPSRWLVLDSSGRLVARAEMPAGARILEIGEDYLLAAVTDELDVEHVRMWRIER